MLLPECRRDPTTQQTHINKKAICAMAVFIRWNSFCWNHFTKNYLYQDLYSLIRVLTSRKRAVSKSKGSDRKKAILSVLHGFSYIQRISVAKFSITMTTREHTKKRTCQLANQFDRFARSNAVIFIEIHFVCSVNAEWLGKYMRIR